MELKKLIEQLVAEGKSDSDIAGAVLENSEGKSLHADEIVSAIETAKKSEAVLAALKAKARLEEDAKAAVAAKASEEKRLSELVDEKLKGIEINFGKYKTESELKRFNARTGKVEAFRPTEEYKAFNQMLVACNEKDFKAAKDISNEIDVANDMREIKVQGLAKATPTVSDVSSRGGYSIPTEVADQVMQLLYERSVTLALCNKDNVMYNSKIYPIMYGMSVGYISDQSTAATEKNPTFSNPSIDMKRIGGYSAISNTIIRQKGADITNSFVAAYASALAEFFDLHIPCGNITGASDLIDGICFDPNTSTPTAIALANLTLSSLSTIKNTLSAKANLAQCAWVANRTVSDKIGLLETTGGVREFPGYIEGRAVSPFGIKLVTNPQIPSTLDITGDNRTGGTDDALILADFSKVILGVSGDMRIDSSDHFLFTSDLMVMRMIQYWGMKVVSSSSTAGVVAIAQKLTN